MKRLACVRIRLLPATRARLRKEATRLGVVESDIVRLGVALVLEALRDDPRPPSEQIGFPPHLAGRLPRFFGARTPKRRGPTR